MKDVATATRLLELGLDEFVHPPAADASQIAGMLVGRNIPVTTTIANWDAYRDTTGAERGFWGASPPYTPAMRQTFERFLKTVRGFADAGVKLVVGTDWVSLPRAGNGFVVDDPRLLSGALTLYELEVLHRAGFPTPAILTAATRNAAEALQIIDKVGTIAEGKLADLVVLDGDFLQDFSALYRTVAVLEGGRVVHGTLPER
jgi:imidazolonepropionase-like amidohydrolase